MCSRLYYIFQKKKKKKEKEKKMAFIFLDRQTLDLMGVDSETNILHESVHSCTLNRS